MYQKTKYLTIDTHSRATKWYMGYGSVLLRLVQSQRRNGYKNMIVEMTHVSGRNYFSFFEVDAIANIVWLKFANHFLWLFVFLRKFRKLGKSRCVKVSSFTCLLVTNLVIILCHIGFLELIHKIRKW